MLIIFYIFIYTSAWKLNKADRRSLILGVEPVNKFETYFLNTVEDTVKLCRDVEEPNMKVHLDTFHMNIEDEELI